MPSRRLAFWCMGGAVISPRILSPGRGLLTRPQNRRCVAVAIAAGGSRPWPPTSRVRLSPISTDRSDRRARRPRPRRSPPSNHHRRQQARRGYPASRGMRPDYCWLEAVAGAGQATLWRRRIPRSYPAGCGLDAAACLQHRAKHRAIIDLGCGQPGFRSGPPRLGPGGSPRGMATSWPFPGRGHGRITERSGLESPCPLVGHHRQRNRRLHAPIALQRFGYAGWHPPTPARFGFGWRDQAQPRSSADAPAFTTLPSPRVPAAQPAATRHGRVRSAELNRSFAPWLANHPRNSEHQLSTEVCRGAWG